MSFLPRVAGIGMSSLSIVLFAVMTGAGATVVRASLMALLVLLARATGRVSEMATLLFVAAFAMLMHNPKILVFDPSFQLSFLATIGLLFLAPRWTRYFSFLPKRFGIREAASATVATQIFVFPFIAYTIGEISVVSFLVNILILPLIPLSMLFSFLAATTGFFHYILSIPFSFTAFTLLEYELLVTKFFASFTYASVVVTNFSFVSLIFVYATLIFLFFWRTKEKKKQG